MFDADEKVGGRWEGWVGRCVSCKGVVCKLEEVGLLYAFTSHIFDATLVKSSL